MPQTRGNCPIMFKQLRRHCGQASKISPRRHG
jgi:hypothetical protein